MDTTGYTADFHRALSEVAKYVNDDPSLRKKWGGDPVVRLTNITVATGHQQQKNWTVCHCLAKDENSHKKTRE